MLLRASKESSIQSAIRDRAVVMLNLQGGPTQFETFDPKMNVPSEIRSMFGEVKTSLPGITFGSHFPRLAKMAHRLAVVRSYHHGISSHETAAKHVAGGGNATRACMGSLYSMVAGRTNPRTGMPSNSIVIPAAIDEKYRSFNAVPSRVTDTGSISSTHKAFDPSSGGALVDDMTLSIPPSRFDDRRELVTRLDRIWRRLDSDAMQAADSFQQQAVDMILGGAGEAFNWAKEDPRLIERYDTSQFAVPQSAVDQRGEKTFIGGHSPVALGKQMLLARRLCEAGCRFITVTCAGWDMHGGHEFAITDGMPILGPAVDRAVSTFLEDVADRGLSDQILLVIVGEFGRTPKIGKKGGRDHWGNLCPLVFAGGGLPMGQVIGSSDRFGGSPASDPVTSSQLFGTIMHYLIDIDQLRTRVDIGPDVLAALADCQPIPQLS